MPMVMEPFLITLSNNAVLSGLASLPKRSSNSPQFYPLLVAVHGGTYSSEYFNASPSHSGGTISVQFGVPFVAIDRPGYRGSSALPSIPSDSSFFQEEGRYMHQYILPRLWEEYGQSSGASTIVLMGHSLGCSACIIAPALHSQEKEARYPLAGVVLSGRSITSRLTKSQGEAQLAEARRVGYVEYPPGVKDPIMFGDPNQGFATPELRRISEQITQRGLVGEFEDRRLQWDNYWTEYAKQVKVPVMAAIGEHDRLFEASQKDLYNLTSAFTASPKVETVFVAGAPHCLELSHWGTGWYARCFGFAIECATSAALA
ncbi:hypothetical protein H2200_008712 [Cladophialophora chaetospira]|uniref:AB hydrolase-1 domain-containing protein n=1 Tax=Cladophialophora chaetospira TaxID=386627 RepID=A0AA38X4K0_9EURO|nr:hypothetical protein H2200_008712 [Cladophialophora chaetospira]